MEPSCLNLFFHSHGQTMQLRSYLLMLLFFIQTLYANNLDKVTQAIQSQNVVQMIHVFDTLEPMTLSEARNFLNELYHQLDQPSDLKKKKSNSFFSNLHLMRCNSHLTKIGVMNSVTATTYDPFLVFNFFKDELLQCVRDSKIKALLNTKMYHQLDRISTLFLFCNDFEEDIVPVNLVLGGVEIFVGVLVAILPFPYAREAGIALILDGTYRAFDGTGEMDEQNKAYIFGREVDTDKG